MSPVNIHDAKTHFSKLIEQVSRGESVVIARAGKPVARMAPIDVPVRGQRLGFMAGQIVVPDDFDRLGEGEIEALFGGK